jgi:hypothetical protein
VWLTAQRQQNAAFFDANLENVGTPLAGGGDPTTNRSVCLRTATIARHSG